MSSDLELKNLLDTELNIQHTDDGFSTIANTEIAWF